MITMIEPTDAAIATSDAVITPVSTPVAVAAQALALVSTQVAAFNSLEAGFTELEQRYTNVVYAVETTAGLDEAKKARAEIRQVRFNAQNLLKETTRPLNQLKTEVTQLADSIVARILLTETPIDEQIKIEETRKATEKAAKEQAERELAAAIQARFQPLEVDFDWVHLTAAQLLEKASAITAIEVSLEIFGARAGEAALLQSNTLDQLGKMHVTALNIEESQRQLAEQQRQLEAGRQAMEAELAAGRQLLAEQQAAAASAHAAAERQLNDRLAQLAAEQQAAQDKIDAEHAAARAAQDAIDTAARQALQDQADEAARVVRKQEAADRKRLDDEAQAKRIEADRLAAEARAAIDLANAKELQLRDAAPALLEALSDLASQIEGYQDCNGYKDISTVAARAAIYQAQGEQA